MEGALDWALPQPGGGGLKAPGGPPISLTCREEAFHQPLHHQQGCVCAGIPAWTGGRHFLGMANPVPQPNQGAAQGCNCQSLQESRQASGMESVFPSAPRAGFP